MSASREGGQSRASHTTTLALTDVHLPADSLIGLEGDGLSYALEGLEHGRLGIASQSIGIARAALEPFDPNAVVAFGPSETVPLLRGKTRVDGKPTLYVCERFACRAPVTEL